MVRRKTALIILMILLFVGAIGALGYVFFINLSRAAEHGSNSSRTAEMRNCIALAFIESPDLTTWEKRAAKRWPYPLSPEGKFTDYWGREFLIDIDRHDGYVSARVTSLGFDGIRSKDDRSHEIEIWDEGARHSGS